MRNFYTIKLPIICVALAILMALAASAASAQTAGNSQAATTAVAEMKPPDSPGSPCPEEEPLDELSVEFYNWVNCEKANFFMRGVAHLLGPALRIRLGTQRIADASESSTSTLSLSSSTPFLPFLGNRLVVLSYVLNGASLASATNAYSVALRRQADCSLNEDFVQADAATPNAAFVTSLPDAQDYLHQLSGLATTADVFAHGCSFQTLGLPSTASVLLLGSTPDGGAISAELTNNGALLASVTDPTTNTFHTITVGSNVNGGFSAADLNGDGFMDLVGTFATDPVTHLPATAVFLGNGDGTFKPGVYYDVAGDITIDDVTGDSKPDIVVLTSPGVVTLIGKGDGTFPTQKSSTTSQAFFGEAAGEILTGKFTSSGNKDLIADGTVLLGAGDGTFTAGSPITSDSSFNFSSSIANTAVGDLNNDGKLDAVVSEPGFVAIFYGKGDGTFQAGPRYATLPDFEQMTITDIDGDGNPDIVLGTSTEGIYTDGGIDIKPPLFQILLGRGDGTFVDSVVYNQGAYGGANAGLKIASADFTGDTKPDVLVFNPSNDGGSPSSLVVLPGDGAGNLGTALTSPINMTPRMMVAADMNHDGKPDAVLAGNGLVATSNAGPLLSVMINQGNGTFAGEQDYALPNNAVSLAVGDFNGDGRMDVAVGVASPGASGATGVYVLLGQSNGTLGAPMQIDSSLLPTGLAAGSLTSDGRTDLVVADQGSYDFVGSPQQINGALHVYLGNTNGTFTAAATPTTSATNYTVAALGDLNHDGKLDLILTGNVAPGTSGVPGTPNVYTLLGNGDGTFQAANTLALAGSDGIGATSLALADFDKDGNLDMAAGNPDDFTEVLLGNGDGTLTDTLLTLGQRPDTVAAADLTGSGFPELLVGTGTSFAVFLNGGANTWTSLTTTTATQTALASATNPSVFGQQVMLTATVTPSSGTTLPTGNVAFFDGVTSIGVVSLDNTGKAVLQTSALGAGPHSLTAQYAGSATFSGSTSSPTLSQVVDKDGTTLALVSSGDPSVSGQSVTFTATVVPSIGSGTPTGTATFLDNGIALGAAVTLNGQSVAMFPTSSLAVGAHPITVQYSGDANFDASTSVSVTQTVNPAGKTATTTALSGPSSAGQGTNVTFTATVTPNGGTPAPTGTVTFFDGNAMLGTGGVNGSGVATFSTSTLSLGQHSITGQYGGDTNFASSSTSTAVSITINPPSSAFTLSASPDSIRVTPLTPGVTQITVTPTQAAARVVKSTVRAADTNQAIVFSCASLPASVSCSFDPPSVTLGTASATTKLTIRETGDGSVQFGKPANLNPAGAYRGNLATFLEALKRAHGLLAGLLLAELLFTSFFWLRKRTMNPRSRRAMICAAALFAGIVFGMSGCSTSENPTTIEIQAVAGGQNVQLPLRVILEH